MTDTQCCVYPLFVVLQELDREGGGNARQACHPLSYPALRLFLDGIHKIVPT